MGAAKAVEMTLLRGFLQELRPKGRSERAAERTKGTSPHIEKRAGNFSRVGALELGASTRYDADARMVR